MESAAIFVGEFSDSTDGKVLMRGDCSDKSFTCQEGLDVHLNPVEITCKSW
jgi:hypothetical protein